jgi:hypothetical protein
MHVQMAYVVFAVAASPDIDHALNIALHMVVNFAAQIHGGVAWFLECVLVDPTSAAGERAPHSRVRSKHATEAATE